MSEGRILIVDDEPKLIRLVQEVLTAVGFEVVAARNAQQAIENEFSDVPIIMLTAKVKEADMLRGFEAGVDDYITKPFSSKELLARVRAVLKRSQVGLSDPTESEIVCGDLIIDLPKRRVSVRGREVHLTPTEYRLLYELCSHRDQVLIHEQLLVAVWGYQYRDDHDYLRTYIYQLRQKLEEDPGQPKMILRCRGVGYMLACDEQEKC
jgi:DNA-binding response OmpR family regulator